MDDSKELSLKDIFNIFIQYKYIIFFITLVSFIISYIIAFYKPNIYQASSTVLIEKEAKPVIKEGDVLGGLFNVTSNSSLNTEKEIIKSRFLVEKVIKKLSLDKDYIAIDKLYKKHFFYKNFPLEIKILGVKNATFKIIPKTSKVYLLKANGVYENGDNFNFSKEFLFNKNYKNSHLQFIVRKKNNLPLNMKEYIINIMKPQYLAEIISSNKLFVENNGENTSILKILYIDTIPKRAQDFVNFLTKIYMEQTLKNKTKEITYTLNFINSQLNKIKKNISLSSQKLEDFKKRTKTIDIKSSIKNLSNQLAEYENERNILTFQIDTLKKIYYKVKKGKDLNSITLFGTGVDNNNISNLVAQLQNALIKRDILLKDYTYLHPEVKKVTSQIYHLKKMIKSSIKNLLNNLINKKNIIERKLSLLNKKLDLLSKNERNFINLEKNFLLNSKFYSYLLEKKTEIEIRKAATVNKNRVLDLAVLPSSPIEPKRKVIYIIGISFGLIVGVLIAFILFLLNRKITTIDDIVRYLKKGVPIIGTIPFSKDYSKEKDINSLEPIIIDEFRNLRMNLSFLLDFNKGGVVCVNSTIDNEGKSFIAANLAKSITKLGKNVLIIDTNLKNPTLDKIFNIDNSKGLVSYLKGKEFTQSDMIQRKDGVFILPTGGEVSNASELISSNYFLDLLDYLRKVYDFIIIDTPSLLNSSEVKNIIRYSDVILYIFKIDYSYKDYIQIVNKLSITNKIGVVINNVHEIKDKFKYDMLDIYNYSFKS